MAQDLRITQSVNRKNVKTGETITLTITVTNLGPGTATGIVFGSALPNALDQVSLSCTPGTQVFEGFCYVASLAPGGSVTAIMQVTPKANPGRRDRRLTSTAFIADCATVDPNINNNTASVSVHIIAN